jgi:hypothetical protein
MGLGDENVREREKIAASFVSFNFQMKIVTKKLNSFFLSANEKRSKLSTLCSILIFDHTQSYTKLS